MNRFFPATVSLLSLLASGLATSAPAVGPSPDEAGIKAVITQFQSTLKAKNEAGLVQLFTSKEAPITASASDKALQFVRTKKADAPKVMDSTGGKFASQMAAGRSAVEEQFSNVKIDSDGAAAAVSFDFVFLADGKPANLGKEAWLLVKTLDGWKISAIVYSIHFPQKT